MSLTSGSGSGTNGLFSSSIDRLKESFLYAAAQGGNSQDVQSLLEIGAEIDWRGQGGDTPLLAACRRGHCETMALLTAHGSNVNTLSTDGMSCLHIAARRGDIASLNVLLDADCNIDLKDKDGKTALDIAKAKDHEDIVQRLIQYRRGISSSSGAGTMIREIVRQAQNDSKEDAKASISTPATINSPRRAAAAPVPVGARPNSALSNESKLADEMKELSVRSSAALGSGSPREMLDACAPPKTSAPASAAAISKQEQILRPVGSANQSYALIGSIHADATASALAKLLEAEEKKRQRAEDATTQLSQENQRMAESMTIALEQIQLLTSELASVQQELDLLKGSREALESSVVTLATCTELDRVLKAALENVEARKNALLRASFEQQKEQKLCVICQENDKSVVLLPCRHLCLCEPCSVHDDLNQCPLCRRPIAHRISVYS